MNAIVTRLDRKLRTIAEEAEETSWKDPSSSEYDRQVAEDALFHTIGPLTETPRWDRQWTSPSKPVPGFTPGGPAPKWTPEEVTIAYAGDPKLLFSGKGGAKSPEYGRQGGSPMFRIAKRVSRVYKRDNDRSFIADMYGNGMVALSQYMHPGYDQGHSAFISWITRNIQSAMEHGIGGDVYTAHAAGGEGTVKHSSFGSGQKEETATSVRGMAALMDETDPKKVRDAASVVKGKYRDQRSHDKTPENPFGAFSSLYYQTAMQYADALEAKDEEGIERARSRMQQLIDDIDSYSTPIRGASTGMGQAISTPDRSTSVGVVSMDAPTKGSENEAGMVGNIMGDTGEDSMLDPETITYILNIALNYDVGSILGANSKYQALATQLGGKSGVGGKMTVNELRYVIRTLGPLGSNYPGRGTPRKNVTIPRDSRGWWMPGEDPELEPLPRRAAMEDADSGMWHSIWSRSGYGSMGPTAISIEMTKEIAEFAKLGIPTGRKVTVKAKGEEAVSKVAVANTLKAATIKLKIIADIHRQQLGLDDDIHQRGGAPTGGPEMECLQRIHASGIIFEGMDRLDAEIIAETCETLARLIRHVAVFENDLKYTTNQLLGAAKHHRSRTLKTPEARQSQARHIKGIRKQGRDHKWNHVKSAGLDAHGL